MRTPFLLLSLLPTALLGQEAGAGQPGPRAELDPARETALARSAAPASVSATATVWHFRQGRYVVADSGDGTAACAVIRSWPDSLEPECFDAEGAATIMRMEMFRTELLHRGVAMDEVERQVTEGVSAGRFRYPSRLSVVYMMSDGQQLIDDDGTPAGHWKPHLMLYYPYLTNGMVGHATRPGTSGGMVVGEGQPTANLMVIVPAFEPVANGTR